MNRLNCYYITEKELNAFFVLCGFQSKEKINKRVENTRKNYGKWIMYPWRVEEWKNHQGYSSMSSKFCLIYKFVVVMEGIEKVDGWDKLMPWLDWYVGPVPSFLNEKYRLDRQIFVAMQNNDWNNLKLPQK